MTRLLVPIIAFSLGLGAALALVSCGDDDEGLLPGDTAEEILQNLEAVESQAAAGDCTEAAEAAEQVAAQVDRLGPDVSNRLKRALADGADQLEAVVDTCEEEPVAPPPDTTEIPTDEVTDTVETDDEEAEEPEETDETETAPPTETAPATPVPPTTPPPGPPTDDGENGNGGGDGGTGSGGIGPGRVTGGD